MAKPKKSRLTHEEIQALLDKTVIKEQEIVNELQTSFMEYAMSVIVSRALPDARDGLKPVHRRVLYAAFGLGLLHDRPFKKSARLVGEIIGKYHPHGDSAAYQAMVRMAQDFSMRYTLIEGHGNFGSVDGDNAAAMRYTEARLSKISSELLKYIDKNTVLFVENYDGSEIEPSVLPAGFPNLLANGSSGIAVGMATNIPPHCLSEVCDATINLLNNPDLTIDEIKEFIKGPDFPTGGEIIGEEGINSYFNTGKGSVVIRSKYEIEELEHNKHNIIITEIPYMVNKTNLIEKIVELVEKGVITNIADLRDESSRDGIRVLIETKKDVIPSILLNELFRTTPLQVRFSVNNLALVDNCPTILNIKDMLEVFIKHQYDVLIRRFKYDLKKAKDKAHILEGLNIATTNIDLVIQIIKGSKNSEESLSKLMDNFPLTLIQAKAILEMKLRSLSGLEREKIKLELTELLKTVEYIESILNNRYLQTELIVLQIENIKTKYGDERRTTIRTDISADISDEDLIPNDDIVITLSKKGYLKRLTLDTYKLQKRGGVGVQGVKTQEEDDVDKLVITTAKTDLLFFTNLGKVYRIRAHKIPIGSRIAKGIPAINIIGIEKNETISSLISVDDYENYLFFITGKGLGKLVRLELFKKIRQTGKIAIELNPDDYLFGVEKVSYGNRILAASSNGKVVNINAELISVVGRTSKGSRFIRLLDNEKVVGFGTSISGNYVLSIGEKGIGKMTKLENYRETNRGARGVLTLKITEKTGHLAIMKVVNGDENALLMTSKGKIIRLDLTTIHDISRLTQGVKLINIGNHEILKSVAIFNKTLEIKAD